MFHHRATPKGMSVGQTWGMLTVTANIGATTLTLDHVVQWPVGGVIAIATTGDRSSQSQNEVRYRRCNVTLTRAYSTFSCTIM